MPLVYGQDQRVADWVGTQCGYSVPPVTAAIGWEVDGELRAGVYFESALPNTVFAHIASVAGTMPRQLLRAVCLFAFRQMGVERITLIVSTANTQVLSFVTHLGAAFEGSLRRAFGDADGAVFAFWRDSYWAKRLMALPPCGATP
jgi:hypothetical protein